MCCLLEGKVYINDKFREVYENEGKSAKLVVLTNLHIGLVRKCSNVPYDHSFIPPFLKGGG